MTEPGQVIKEARRRRNWSQADLARRAGISQAAINKIESGGTKHSRFFPLLARVLDVPLEELDLSLTRNGHIKGTAVTIVPGPRTNVGGSVIFSLPAVAPAIMGAIDLPVFSVCQGGKGSLVISSEPIGLIARPHNLLGVANSYGVLITDDSMSREFNSGDTAYVNPHLVPRKGDPCIFQSHANDGTVTACIKYLDRAPTEADPTWHVSQSNPERKLKLDRASWQICHVVVGKLSGR